ncbi:hypothetical protein PVL29_017190 [Vitis rotundifolia]|uniref:Uncharacterized protein n=1 Tax=Vitis rotundifolia TaxID=103349 RepID=A0AA39DIB6_VITRO|nr:hypothetical protein PVL29_017190 [Vitis rotundifolia]
MICLVGKKITEPFSLCLCASKKKKKNKETNLVVWLDNNKHLIVNYFSPVLHWLLEGSPCSYYISESKIYTWEDLGQLKIFWDQTAFNSLAGLIKILIKIFIGLKFYENIQIMTRFLNFDQLFQISFLHIPFFYFFLFFG